MFCLDIDKLEENLKGIFCLSIHKFNFLSFYRKNYLPSKDNNSIRDEICKHLNKNGHQELPKKIYILTQLSYLGYCYNPVSFYFCYDNNENLLYILSEVNNTPWNERYVYVQKCSNKESIYNFYLDKEFHISPFLPMNTNYAWKFTLLPDKIMIRMQCLVNKDINLQVAFKVKPQPVNTKNCWKALSHNPFSTFLMHYRIYWQALLLYIKKTPFYIHPTRI